MTVDSFGGMSHYHNKRLQGPMLCLMISTGPSIFVLNWSPGSDGGIKLYQWKLTYAPGRTKPFLWYEFQKVRLRLHDLWYLFEETQDYAFVICDDFFFTVQKFDMVRGWG